MSTPQCWQWGLWDGLCEERRGRGCPVPDVPHLAALLEVWVGWKSQERSGGVEPRKKVWVGG